MNYILIYEINDYPENGGGIEYELFDTLQGLTDFVNSLNHEKKEIKHCFEVKTEIKFKPVEIVTKWEIDN